jgi:hypothetical protein
VASCEVTDSKEQLQRTQDTQRRCPICAALPRLAQTMLDSRKGKMVRLFKWRIHLGRLRPPQLAALKAPQLIQWEACHESNFVNCTDCNVFGVRF